MKLPDDFDIQRLRDSVMRAAKRNYAITWSDLDDRMQEALMDLLRTDQRHFRGVETLPTLLHLKVRTAIYEDTRKRKGRRKAKAQQIPLDPSHFDIGHWEESKDLAEIDAADSAMFLHEAIEQLPDDLRQIVRLRAFDQLPWQEVSEIIGLSVNKCLSRFSRAKDILRHHLQSLDNLI